MKKEKKLKKIIIDGIEYVSKEEIEKINKENLTLCILRTYSAGVWFGYVDYNAEDTFSNVIVYDAIRIWSWSGAFTLSAVAMDGINKDSKLARPVNEVKLNRVIELIPVTKKAADIINSIKTHEI